jgi:hypothetical protein
MSLVFHNYYSKINLANECVLVLYGTKSERIQCNNFVDYSLKIILYNLIICKEFLLTYCDSRFITKKKKNPFQLHTCASMVMDVKGSMV